MGSGYRADRSGTWRVQDDYNLRITSLAIKLLSYMYIVPLSPVVWQECNCNYNYIKIGSPLHPEPSLQTRLTSDIPADFTSQMDTTAQGLEFKVQGLGFRVLFISRGC